MAASVIIDTDPGQDDALAILLALSAQAELDVTAITTVAGNVGAAQCCINALRVCQLAGRPDVPVYTGCPQPILRPLHTAEFICGPDGLAAITRLLEGVGAVLVSGGAVVMEIGKGQEPLVAERVVSAGLELVRVVPDLAGIPRVVVARER